jgi:hypothetical protein
MHPIAKVRVRFRGLIGESPHWDHFAELVRIRSGLRDFTDLLGTKIGVPLQLIPRLMKRELSDFMNLVAALKQTAGRFVSQIVKA